MTAKLVTLMLIVFSLAGLASSAGGALQSTALAQPVIDADTLIQEIHDEVEQEIEQEAEQEATQEQNQDQSNEQSTEQSNTAEGGGIIDQDNEAEQDGANVGVQDQDTTQEQNLAQIAENFNFGLDVQVVEQVDPQPATQTPTETASAVEPQDEFGSRRR
jgi:hypothetical protein